jgi:hypothetical protein
MAIVVRWTNCKFLHSVAVRAAVSAEIAFSLTATAVLEVRCLHNVSYSCQSAECCVISFCCVLLALRYHQDYLVGEYPSETGLNAL